MVLAISECGSELLKPTQPENEAALTCSRCGATETRESFAARAIETVRSAYSYEAYKDGGDEPIIDCPSCDAEAYIMAECRCAACGFEAQHECELCGSEVPANEMIFSPMCGGSSRSVTV